MANVFISHSSKDHVIAEKLCGLLEANGISCWMAPRDIKPGEEWAKAINDAITASDVFIIIYSAASAESTQVPKEIGLAGARNVYIVPYKIDGTELKGEFEYHLLNSHWVVADIAKNDYKINELCETIRNVVNKKGHDLSGGGNVNITNNIGQVNVTGVQNNGTINVPSFISKNKVPILALAAAVVIALIFSGISKGAAKAMADLKDNISAEQNTTSVSMENETSEQNTAPKQDSPEKQQDSLANADIVQVPVDLEPYEYKGTIYKNDKEKNFTMAGQTFNTGIVLNRSDGAYILFNNSGKYEKMKFTVGHLDGYNRDELKIRINYDGEEAEVFTIKPSALPTEYELDISGVTGIEITLDYSMYKSLIGFTDFYMYKDSAAGSAEVQSDTYSESSQDHIQIPVDMSPYECNGTIYNKDKEKNFTVAGNTYNTGVVLDRSNSGYCLLNNTNGYDKMKFTVGHLDGYNRDELKLRIFLDGEEAEVIPIKPYVLPTEYEIDITDVNGIEIVLDYSMYKSNVGLTDFYLYDTICPEKAVKTADADYMNVPADLSPYESNGKIYINDKEKNFSVAGEIFNTGITLDRSKDGYILINNTDYGYNKMKFTVGHCDQNYQDELKLRIYYDNQEAEVISIPPFTLPVEYEFDISDVKGIAIKLDYSMYGSHIGLTDFYLYNDISPVRENRTAENDIAIVPSDVFPYEFKGTVYDNDKEKNFSMAGETYNTGITLNRDGSGYFLINNTNYGYTKMKFTAGYIDNFAGDNLTLRIYLDNEETEVIKIAEKTVPQQYELDITDVKGIVFQLDYSMYKSLIGLTDFTLSK